MPTNRKKAHFMARSYVPRNSETTAVGGQRLMERDREEASVSRICWMTYLRYSSRLTGGKVRASANHSCTAGRASNRFVQARLKGQDSTDDMWAVRRSTVGTKHRSANDKRSDEIGAVAARQFLLPGVEYPAGL